MISFPCHCGHRFDLDEEMAGALIQCPDCGRLNDVPTHDDLRNIDADGTYRLDEPVQDAPGRLEELGHIYHPGKVDDEGHEIDLRSYENLIAEDEQGIPLQPDRPPQRGIPKYDPETGELLRPLEVKPDAESVTPANPEDIPLARPAAIPYARTDMQHRVTPFKVPFLLLTPVNVIVLFFIFLLHLFPYLIVYITLSGYFLVIFLLGPFLLLIPLLVLSHYANTIEDIGPQENDELPRPMRSGEWYEDIWRPFTNFIGAFVICYLPAMAVTWIEIPWPELTRLFMVVLIGLGTWVMPAALLTTTTSGTALNLSPLRIMGVMRACGLGYVWAVILWIAAAGAYAAALGLLPAVARTVGVSGVIPWLNGYASAWWFMFPTLTVAIYLMHLFCWHLGLLYRAHYYQFPWLLQRHEWSPRTPLPPRRRRRPAAHPPTGEPANPAPNPPDARQRLQRID